MNWNCSFWLKTKALTFTQTLYYFLRRFAKFFQIISSSVAKQEPGVSGVSTKSQSRGSRKTHKLMNIGLVYVNSYYGYNLSFITRMANVIQHLGCNNSVNIDSHKFRINL